MILRRRFRMPAVLILILMVDEGVLPWVRDELEAQGVEIPERLPDAQIAAAAEAHPEFEGTSIIQVADTPDTFYVYEEADPRVQFLTDLGFVDAPAVTELATDESTFYVTLSKERLGELQSDVLVARARAFIVASPFVVLATSGKDGTDASPRGGPPAGACALRDHLDLDVGPDVITADLDAGYPATMWEPGGSP